MVLLRDFEIFANLHFQLKWRRGGRWCWRWRDRRLTTGHWSPPAPPDKLKHIVFRFLSAMPQPPENMTQHARLLITDYKVVKNQMGETRHFMSLSNGKMVQLSLKTSSETFTLNGVQHQRDIVSKINSWLFLVTIPPAKISKCKWPSHSDLKRSSDLLFGAHNPTRE